jgi:ATP-dependent RNA helicase DDX41
VRSRFPVVESRLMSGRIPEFLLSIDDPRAKSGGSLKGCPICGGLGHGLSDCPKLEEETRRKQAANQKYSGGGY